MKNRLARLEALVKKIPDGPRWFDIVIGDPDDPDGPWWIATIRLDNWNKEKPQVIPGTYEADS